MQATSEGPSSQPASEICWRFGAFRVSETQRRIEKSGHVVRLGPRSFDLLLQLIKRAGEFVSKDELLATVWAGLVVEDGSVRVHMSMLRKWLGDPDENDECSEWFTNIPLRGYRFNGRVVYEKLDGASGQALPLPASSFSKPPVRLTGLIGREADVEGLVATLAECRLVTIVGTGGIGKTSVAIRVAERYRATHDTEMAFVDLSPLMSKDHVLSTMARSLGATADLPDTVQSIIQRLQGHDVLVMIDNCEHVVDSIASPITRLLEALPGLRVLATSREALRLAGEYVVRLPALAFPDDGGLTLAQAMEYPSVRLLVERAEAAGAGTFNESQGPALATISRQLDGIPLAIELVAARLGAQSASDLAMRLDDHMRLYSATHRATLPRHQSLAAALDWSIDLLDEHELQLFRRLAVFRGRFDVESALCLASDQDPDIVFDALISLTNKSLVFFDGNDAIAPYRLLDTTRSYATALLEKSDERRSVLRRHAICMLDLMKAATAELQDLTEQAWGDRYAYRLDDLRFALDVCLTGEEDAKLAASLVAASASLWFHVSQVVEFQHKIEAALALMERHPSPDVEAMTWLNTALVGALLHTGGSIAELNTACNRALTGALTVKIPVLEMRARWGQCTHDMFRGEYQAALQHSETLHQVAQSWYDPAALILSHRVSAMANHFCGRFEVSLHHSEAAIGIGTEVNAGRKLLHAAGSDAVVSAKALLSRTLWIQGRNQEALAVASDAVARAEAIGHAVSLCTALYGACAVALWAEEQELATTWVHLMKDEAQRRGLLGWMRYADWFLEGLQLAAHRGRISHDIAEPPSSYDAPRHEMLVTFCPTRLDDTLIGRLEHGEGLWCAAEIRRAEGLHREWEGRLDDAERLYLQALEIAQQQGAFGWELRAAQNLATLWAKRAEPAKAVSLLDATLMRAPSGSEGIALTGVRKMRARFHEC